MRNITVFTVLVIMANCALCIGAQEQDEPRRPWALRPYAFSISPRFGFLFGQAEEIVYPSSEYKAELLSQLLWDMQPVVYSGLALDFAQTRPMERWGGFAALSAKIGISGKSGKMEDRDWQSYENTELTSYSIHDNVTGEMFLIDINAGFSIPIMRLLLLKPYISGSYMRFNFSGRYGEGTYARSLGDGKYAPIDDDPKQEQFSQYEIVITYTQNWLTLNAGLSLGYYFLNHFYAELFFQISPFIRCGDHDQHLTRDVEFLDFMRGGLLIEPGFHFSYYISEQLELNLEFSWRHIGGTRGETWYRGPIDQGYYWPEGEAGAGLSVFDTGLRLKIRL